MCGAGTTALTVLTVPVTMAQRKGRASKRSILPGRLDRFLQARRRPARKPRALKASTVTPEIDYETARRPMKTYRRIAELRLTIVNLSFASGLHPDTVMTLKQTGQHLKNIITHYFGADEPAIMRLSAMAAETLPLLVENKGWCSNFSDHSEIPSDLQALDQAMRDGLTVVNGELERVIGGLRHRELDALEVQNHYLRDIFHASDLTIS